MRRPLRASTLVVDVMTSSPIRAVSPLAPVAVLALLACSSGGTEPDAARANEAVARRDFERVPVGSLPLGLTNEVGEWKVVVLPEGGRGLAQLAQNERAMFNLALVDEPELRDLVLRV